MGHNPHEEFISNANMDARGVASRMPISHGSFCFLLHVCVTQSDHIQCDVHLSGCQWLNWGRECVCILTYSLAQSAKQMWAREERRGEESRGPHKKKTVRKEEVLKVHTEAPKTPQVPHAPAFRVSSADVDPVLLNHSSETNGEMPSDPVKITQTGCKKVQLLVVSVMLGVILMYKWTRQYLQVHTHTDTHMQQYTYQSTAKNHNTVYQICKKNRGSRECVQDVL